MSYSVLKKCSPIETLIAEFPLSNEAKTQIAKDSGEVKAILEGKERRKLLIVGPCSAWPKEAVLEYAKRLVSLNEKVKHALKVVMRVYIQKPRTTKGWNGPIHQPDLFLPPNIEAGVRYTRDMMVKVIEMGLPIADEALFTHNAKGFLELLSWVAIGARSVENQEHRIFASALDCAVGMKNPTHGSLAIGINGIIAAQHPHVTVLDGHEVQTHGNPFAHLVLRGSNNAPNYSITNLEAVLSTMKNNDIQNPSVIIDASHDNCKVLGKKDFHRQPQIVFEVMETLKKRPDLNRLVKGFMMESFILEGRQDVHPNQPELLDIRGLSITDPCLGWEATEACLLELAKQCTV